MDLGQRDIRIPADRIDGLNTFIDKKPYPLYKGRQLIYDTLGIFWCDIPWRSVIKDKSDNLILPGKEAFCIKNSRLF